MNLEQSFTPPTSPKKRTPEKKKRLNPPPKPEKAKAKEPELVLEAQDLDVMPAQEVRGFEGLKVAVTTEKKDANKALGERNQDFYIADSETGLIGVFDGLGGEGNGERASLAASEAFPNAYTAALQKSRETLHETLVARLVDQQLARKGSKGDLKELHRKELTAMTERMQEIDPAMLRKSVALVDAFEDAQAAVMRSHGKTTASIGFVHRAPDGTCWAVIANTGDSATFKRRKNGELVPITEEDSFLTALQRNGVLSKDQLDQMRKNPYEKIFAFGKEKLSYRDLRSGMSAALGVGKGDTFMPTLSIRQMEEGDELLMATDGLMDVFDNDEKQQTDLKDLATTASIGGDDPVEIADHLRQEVRMRDDIKDDDVTILVAKVI